MLAGIAGSLVQNPFQITWDRIEPKWSRLSPREGFRRLFGIKGLAEFVKSIFKFSAVGTICYLVVKSELPDMIASLIRPPQLLPGDASAAFDQADRPGLRSPHSCWRQPTCSGAASPGGATCA